MGEVTEPVAYFDHPDQVSEPGFYTLSGDPEVDDNDTEHHTNMEPDMQVYPSPDGEGFVYDKPEVPEEGGE